MFIKEVMLIIARYYIVVYLHFLGMTALMMARRQGSGEIAWCLEVAGASRTMRDDVHFWTADQWSSRAVGHLLTAVVGELSPALDSAYHRRRYTASYAMGVSTCGKRHASKSRVRSAGAVPQDLGTDNRSYPRRLEQSQAESFDGCPRQRAVSCPVGVVCRRKSTPPITYLDNLFRCYSQQCSHSYRTSAPAYIQPDQDESEETMSHADQSVSVRICVRVRAYMSECTYTRASVGVRACVKLFKK